MLPEMVFDSLYTATEADSSQNPGIHLLCVFFFFLSFLFFFFFFFFFFSHGQDGYSHVMCKDLG